MKSAYASDNENERMVLKELEFQENKFVWFL